MPVVDRPAALKYQPPSNANERLRSNRASFGAFRGWSGTPSPTDRVLPLGVYSVGVVHVGTRRGSRARCSCRSRHGPGRSARATATPVRRAHRSSPRGSSRRPGPATSSSPGSDARRSPRVSRPTIGSTAGSRRGTPPSPATPRSASSWWTSPVPDRADRHPQTRCAEARQHGWATGHDGERGGRNDDVSGPVHGPAGTGRSTARFLRS